MSARVFLDTNILLYSISRDPADVGKREVALRLLNRADCILSVQVLQEFLVQATRPTRADRISQRDAIDLLTGWRRFPVVDLTAGLFDAAIAIQERHRFSYWDCAIIAAARAGGCDTLYSEDMDHGRVIDGTMIGNPFRDL